MSLDIDLHVGDTLVYSANITHNLGKMAERAGIYKALWRPEEIDCKVAKDIADVLRLGLIDMVTNPAPYKAIAPENGWGTYEGLVSLVIDYHEACVMHPDAVISVGR